MPADAEPASEFRYRNPVIEEGTLVHRRQPVRRDLRHACRGPGGQAQGRPGAWRRQHRREHDRARVDGGVYLHAGPRSSVTSTKTFTATATVFALLALHLARIHDLPRLTAGGSAPACASCPSRSRRSWRWRKRSPSLAKDLAAVSRHVLRRPGRAAGPSPGRAPRSSRRSPTCTPRPTPPAS